MPKIDVEIDNISSGLESLAVDIDSVTPDPNNAREHPERNMKMIKDSLTRYGQTKPIVIRETTRIILAGNGTWQAAKELGWTKIAANPVQFGDTESTDYGIIDNRSAELAKWNMEVLSRMEYLKNGTSAESRPELWNEEELKALRLAEWCTYNPDTDPFTTGALGLGNGTTTNGDPSTTKKAEITRTSVGDIWLIEGGHKLAVGDCTDKGLLARLMGDDWIGLLFTSPPYWQQRTYEKVSTKQASGKQETTDWEALMRATLDNASSYIPRDGQVLVNLGLVHRDNEWIPYWNSWIEWMRSEGWRRFGFYVWDQMAGLPGDWSGRLAPSHEFIFHFNRDPKKPNKFTRTKTSGKHTKYYGLRDKSGKSQRHKGITRHKTVQDYKLSDSVFRVRRDLTGTRQLNKDKDDLGHPAIYPVQLVTEIVRSFCPKDGIVYDPFLGSGSTIVGAYHTGRVAYGCELNPRYADMALRRLELEGLSVEKEISNGKKD